MNLQKFNHPNEIKENGKSKERYIFGINFKYIGIIFALASMGSVLPQLYKVVSTRRAQDFSMLFAFGMLTVNILFFISSFIRELDGMMIGTGLFIIYNASLIYYYYFGVQS